ncbi:MAG: hypothetical protein GC139_07310 [Sideroxydans sp.]|nr:hypothetical protein [Sideroxydans sp.]
MLPADLLNTIKALALTQKPLPAAAPDPLKPGAGSPFEQGQKLQGQVLAEVSPGLFKVRISSQMVQMPLPAAIRPGDTVQLQVVSLQPRLTFGMLASANPLSTPEQLSSASRLLSSLAQQQPAKAQIHASQSTPLWVADKPPQPQQLASQLREALSNSGLFYESHQAQWLEGTRSTAQLLQEPQNLRPAASPAATQQATLGDSISQAAAAAIHGNKLPDIPEHMQALVQQQLNALETSHVVWQGQVWPGQTMQWEIHERTPHTAAAMENERQWATQLHLDLPRLGTVTATLNFNSSGISLTLNASDTQTRKLLGTASSQLVASLSDAGIPVVSTQVTQDEPIR